MNAGRDALDKIKDQVEVIKKLQNETQMKLNEMNRNIAREKGRLKKLVENFPREEKAMYIERIYQIIAKVEK